MTARRRRDVVAMSAGVLPDRWAWAAALLYLAPAACGLIPELADSYQYGYEPSLEAQDAFFAAVQHCGG